jgi:hypothetical protein
MRLFIAFAFLLFSIVAAAQKNANRDKEYERYIDSVRAVNPNAQITFDTLVSRVYDQQIPFKTLSARTKLKWNDGKSEQDFQASIRMKKDSIIWGSLFGAMGVEGARIVVTPDTFMIINKIGNDYALRSFEFLQAWLMFPISFNMLQQTLAGQKVDISETASMAFLQDSSFVIYYETDRLQEKIWVKPENYTITKMVLKDKKLIQEMTITFGDYKELNGKPFSYERSVEVVRGPQVLRFNTTITKISLEEELTFPFEITDRYKKIE